LLCSVADPLGNLFTDPKFGYETPSLKYILNRIPQKILFELICGYVEAAE
jgi:hypothetical protein